MRLARRLVGVVGWAKRLAQALREPPSRVSDLQAQTQMLERALAQGTLDEATRATVQELLATNRRILGFLADQADQ